LERPGLIRLQLDDRQQDRPGRAWRRWTPTGTAMPRARVRAESEAVPQLDWSEVTNLPPELGEVSTAMANLG
jgi:hypothetical protein